MYRNIVIGGVTAAVIVGAGTTALATTGSSTTAGKDTASSTSAHGTHAGKGRHGAKGPLGRLEHGQFVTRGKGTATVTHDLIRGTVTAVSSTSITVQAADKTSETFVVTKDTKVRVRQNGKGAASSISAVATGDRVFVAGTGASTFTAVHVVDSKGAKKK